MSALPDTPAITRPEPLSPGIYFNLPAETYHADDALGSGDMKGLAINPVSWWYWSRFNPYRPEENDTKALIFGRAVHAMALEGREAFDRAFGPCEHPGNIKAGIEERKQLAAQKRTPLARADYDRALIAGHYIRQDPALAKVLSGGVSEVSVIWTRDGIRRKARFDHLTVEAIGDLKSIREQDDMEFEVYCQRQLAVRKLYIQATHYLEARAAMAFLPMVHGEHDPAFLEAVIANGAPRFSWVFYQSTGAPETYGTYTQVGSKQHGIGEGMIRLAEHNYRVYSQRFGLSGEPWVKTRPFEFYDEDSQPDWVWR